MPCSRITRLIRIHDGADQTGSKTLLQIERDGKIYLVGAFFAQTCRGSIAMYQ